MSSIFLFGMSEQPSIWGMVLTYLIVGLIGFALSYIHRYLVFAVVPVFTWLAYYLINDSINTAFSLTEKRFFYLLALLDFSAIVFGAILNWKKYKPEQTNLK